MVVMMLRYSAINDDGDVVDGDDDDDGDDVDDDDDGDVAPLPLHLRAPLMSNLIQLALKLLKSSSTFSQSSQSLLLLSL